MKNPKKNSKKEKDRSSLEYWKKRAEFFEKVLDAIPDMVLVKGPKSHLLWANKSFQIIYNMNNEQLQGIIDSPVNEPDYTQQYVLDDKWVWDNKKLLKIACEPVKRHDGVVLKYETYKTPILDEFQNTKYTVGISRDVTEKIQQEERSASGAKLAALGEMAGGIAHEINNPLAIILGKVRQVENGIEENVPKEKLAKDLKKIEECGFRINKIILGLKKFSRDEGTISFENAPVATIVEDTLSFCSSRFKNSGVQLRLPDKPENISITCNSIQISQIILNLLNNAFDAVQGQRDSWIQLDYKVTGQNLEFRVWDSGAGVPKEIEVKIMQPFFTTKPVGKGTGLGLSVSSSIAQGHNGSLRLDRKFSNSCFLLTLPLQQVKEKTKSAA